MAKNPSQDPGNINYQQAWSDALAEDGERSRAALNKNTLSLKDVGKGLGALAAVVGPLITSIEGFQKRTIAVGTDLQSMSTAFGADLEGMGGGINILNAQMSLLESGMRGWGKNALTLATRTAATGGNVAAMTQMLRSTQLRFLGSQKEMENLSGHIKTLSEDYRISTDEFVKAVAGISQTLEQDAAVLGIGPQLQSAVSEITAILGAGSSKMVNDFTNAFLESGVAGAARAEMLGLTPIRDAILKGDGDIAQLLLQAIDRTNAVGRPLIDAMQSTGGATIGMMGTLRDIYSNMLFEGVRLSENGRTSREEMQRLNEQMALNTAWNETIATLTQEIMAPLLVALIPTLNTIRDVLKTDIAKGVIKIIAIMAPFAAVASFMKGIVPFFKFLGPWGTAITLLASFASFFVGRNLQQKEEKLHQTKMDNEKDFQSLRVGEEKAHMKAMSLYTQGLREHARNIVFSEGYEQDAALRIRVDANALLETIVTNTKVLVDQSVVPPQPALGAGGGVNP